MNETLFIALLSAFVLATMTVQGFRSYRYVVYQPLLARPLQRRIVVTSLLTLVDVAIMIVIL